MLSAVSDLGTLAEREHMTDSANELSDLANEKATRETFDDEGFLHTGDEGHITNECLFIVDRLKELIKANGFQVAPAELEGFLLSHSDVQDVCVIGIPDEKRGEAPKAFVVVSPAAGSRIKSEGRQAEEKLDSALKKYVTDNKIRYKALAEIEFIEAIPKTPSGKLLRKDCKSCTAASEPLTLAILTDVNLCSTGYAREEGQEQVGEAIVQSCRRVFHVVEREIAK